MRWFTNLQIGLLATLSIHPLVYADDPSRDMVYTRIMDTGPGLCTVTRMPGPHYMVYDTGNRNHDAKCTTAIERIVPSGSSIALLIQTPSDSDHLAATGKVLEPNSAKRVIRAEYTRWGKAAWRDAHDAMGEKRKAGTLTDVDLWKLPGRRTQPAGTGSYGDADLMRIAEFDDRPHEWGLFATSKHRNSVSIVMRLTY